MNILSKQTLSKIKAPSVTITTKTRNALLAIAGLSGVFIAKNELGKQEVKKLIDLKKQRLQMVIKPK